MCIDVCVCGVGIDVCVWSEVCVCNPISRLPLSYLLLAVPDKKKASE